MTDCLSFMNLNMILSLLLFGASLLFPLIHIFFSPKSKRFEGISELFVSYALFFNVGCLFILGCAGQLLYGREIAACIGWSWSPFQYELAGSELVLGVLGLLAPLFQRQFWLATTIGASIWLFGASIVHLYYLIALGDMLILNASFVIAWNIVIALWLIALYMSHAKPLTKLFKILECVHSTQA